eukprot:4083168-Prymnesium_polylepis.1
MTPATTGLALNDDEQRAVGAARSTRAPLFARRLCTLLSGWVWDGRPPYRGRLRGVGNIRECLPGCVWEEERVFANIGRISEYSLDIRPIF